MASIREHLENFHESKVKHHTRVAKTHEGISETHGKLATHYRDDPKLSELHKSLSDAHAELADHHHDAADFHEECRKSCGDVTSVKTAIDEALGKRLGDAFARDDRKVVRVPETQPQFGVPAEFEHLIRIS